MSWQLVFLVRWLFAVDWVLVGWLVSGCMVKWLFWRVICWICRPVDWYWLVDSVRYSLLWFCWSAHVVVWRCVRQLAPLKVGPTVSRNVVTSQPTLWKKSELRHGSNFKSRTVDVFVVTWLNAFICGYVVECFYLWLRCWMFLSVRKLRLPPQSIWELLSSGRLRSG